MKRLCSVKVLPGDSREQNFHLALAEYLHKEIKYSGLEAHKQSAAIKINLPPKENYKYSCVVIDCMAGKIFLRGDGARDRYFGRLRRFRNGQRTSDAYHCVAQSANRLINRIKKLIDSLLIEEVL